MSERDRILFGRVSSFDKARGIGALRYDAGSEGAVAEVPFHCTAISDGSRDIAVGREVAFVLRRRHGRLEADAVTPLG